MFLVEVEKKLLSLEKEGLEFEVIPGVTSPIAVLNYAGIPITQRGMCTKFSYCNWYDSSK